MKFEIPYNFNYDDKYFEYLHTIDKSYIDNIYLPIYSNIGKFTNTRENLIQFPSSKEEYDKHISLFKEENIPLSFLIQRFSNRGLIEEYMNISNRFIINNDTLARELKEYYKENIILTLSITRNLTFEEILNTDLSMYDYICLSFYFPHHLQLIEKLPDKYKYLIICNSKCLTNCKHPENHWFEINTEFSKICNHLKFINMNINMQNSSFIRPEDIELFNPYISIFKLEGRELPSNDIFKDLNAYINKKSTNKLLSNFNYSNIKSNYCQKI